MARSSRITRWWQGRQNRPHAIAASQYLDWVTGWVEPERNDCDGLPRGQDRRTLFGNVGWPNGLRRSSSTGSRILLGESGFYVVGEARCRRELLSEGC